MANFVRNYINNINIKVRILELLKQGLSPYKLALTISMGFVLSMFPVIGTTTALTLIFSYFFRLNYILMQLINWLVAPLCFIMIIPFVHLGQYFLGLHDSNISIYEITNAFDNGLIQGVKQVWQYQLYAIISWGISSIPSFAILYFVSIRLIKLYQAKIQGKETV